MESMCYDPKESYMRTKSLICERCGEQHEQPVRQGRDRKYCDNCMEIKRWTQRKNYTPEQGRKWSLNRYGLSREEYDEKAKAQDYLCVICGVQPDLLHVDHDHQTGTVRGLICQACNRGLGGFKDNIDSLYKAILYLEAPMTP